MNIGGMFFVQMTSFYEWIAGWHDNEFFSFIMSDLIAFVFFLSNAIRNLYCRMNVTDNDRFSCSIGLVFDEFVSMAYETHVSFVIVLNWYIFRMCD